MTVLHARLQADPGVKAAAVPNSRHRGNEANANARGQRNEVSANKAILRECSAAGTAMRCICCSERRLIRNAERENRLDRRARIVGHNFKMPAQLQDAFAHSGKPYAGLSSCLALAVSWF